MDKDEGKWREIKIKLGELELILYTKEIGNEVIKIEDKETLEELKHSDLVKGIYEGGLKVWECSIDLVKHLSKIDIKFPTINTLEVGCGHGLPGIYCLLQGSNVSFQDYNKEVIEHVTAPNIEKNKLLSADLETQNLTLIWGDWANIGDQLCPEKYNLILASETLYNLEYYENFYELIKKALKEDGLLIIATKAYYYGVGGGAYSFMEFVEKKEEFEITIHTKFPGNSRLILHMKYKS